MRGQRRAARAGLLFAGAARLESCRVLRGADGQAALFLRTLTHDSRAQLHRLPEGVGVEIKALKQAGQYRAAFSSPHASQSLTLSAGAYVDLLEGLASLREARQVIDTPAPSEDLPADGHTLKCAALFPEGDSTGLYIGTCGPDFAACVYRVGQDVRLSLDLPHPLPKDQTPAGLPTLIRGRLLLEGPQGKAAVSVSTVSTARQMLEALEAYGQAQHGEGKKGAA